MFPAVLILHSLLRWAVVASALFLLAKLLSDRTWSPAHRKASLAFMISVDLQALLGFLLYFVLSPVALHARADMAAAMRDPELRFFGVEHLVAMVLALVLLHVGNVRVKRAADADKVSTATRWFAAAIALIAVSIPWIARPLFRFAV